MQALQNRAPGSFAGIRFVLTDMDETLTYRGRLAAATYTALERLQQAGIRVIPVTAAPAGWCDQMARMWPVDGVIGENGGLFLQRDAHEHHRLHTQFWHPQNQQQQLREQLHEQGQQILKNFPRLRYADDQAFRLTSLAFARTGDTRLEAEVSQALSALGWGNTVNNLWILGWPGNYDKLRMAQRVLLQHYALDDEQALKTVFYSGDSSNDGPMFAHYRHTLGVATVTSYLDQLPRAPAWISKGPGGSGFVEAVDAILADQEQC